MAKNLKLVRKTMCTTCPFKRGSKYKFLKESLTELALKEGRICHSTGSNAINYRTGIPNHICRGARLVQLKSMFARGVIEAPNDKAWTQKRLEIGLGPETIQDPERLI